jgi:hypothetical protein
MSEKDHGGYVEGCLTLRDYFAAKVIQGMMASAECDSVDEDDVEAADERMGWARGAYAMADAMLEARK